MVLLTAREHTDKMKGIKKTLVTTFILGTVSLVAAIVLMFIDPVLIITEMRMKVCMGSPVHEFLKKPLESIHISAYLFNITNSEEFMSGEHHKLKVEEVGPFTYKEMRFNEDLELDLEAGVIKYSPRSAVTFLPEKSVANPDLVQVTMPNLPMLGITSKVSSYPYWTRVGFSLLTSQLNSKPLVTVNASTYLWGYKEPLVTLAHTVLPGFIHFDKMGILDRLYDTKIPNKLVIGATDTDKFMIKTRNGNKKLPMGDNMDPDQCEICDDFTNSYEGIGYPTSITEKTPIRIFRTGLCRMLNMVYHKKVIMDNKAEGLVFNLSDSFYSLNPNVTKNRILDLTDCFYGLPIGLTKVNFLGMDPEFYNRIEGLKPDPTKECYIIIEPKVALELDTYFPVQINLMLKDMSFNREASRFSNLVVPIGYVEIVQPELPEDTKHALKMIYVVGPIIVMVFKVILIISTVILLSYTIFMYLKTNKDKMMSFPVTTMGKNNVLRIQEPLMSVNK